MKRRILLVDDEVAVLLTLKAVLEISGFDVDTAASARDGKHKLRNREYHMVITDMRMESEEAGREVVAAARTASYHPAVALLTAFPLSDDDWQELGADKMLVKPMHTKILLQQIEKLLAAHEAKLKIWSTPAPKQAGVSGNSDSNLAVDEKSSTKRGKVKELTAGPKVRSSGSKPASAKSAGARKSA
jgi:DNA-binding response OmpR family regulator